MPAEFEGGDIFLLIMAQGKEEILANLPYIAFYRTLSKQWHYVNSGRKEARTNAKLDAKKKEAAQKEF